MHQYRIDPPTPLRLHTRGLTSMVGYRGTRDEILRQLDKATGMPIEFYWFFGGQEIVQLSVGDKSWVSPEAIHCVMAIAHLDRDEVLATVYREVVQ